MKRLIQVVILISMLAFSPKSVSANAVSATSTASSDTYTGKPLCLPGVYLIDPGDCLPLGVSSTLTGLAQMGVTLPPPPLTVAKPSSDLNTIPFRYAKVDGKANVPLYLTQADAEAKNVARYLEAGNIRYISYVNRADTSQGVFYQLSNGFWMAGTVARAAPPVFQGYLVLETPKVDFGWILSPTETRATPGYSGKLTGHKLNRLDVVRIYGSKTVDNMEWHMIGVNEWIERRFVSVVTPNETPPPGVLNGRWIEVNLFEQTLMVYEKSKLVFATIISSGVEPFYTRPGLFQIYKKKPSETMTGAFEADRSDYYFLQDVPWTMYFDEARALHGAYWNSLFGYPRSHGCVNLSIGDSRWLYDWAKEGDWVYVWDPSGQTPTDPKYYGQGGA